MAAPLIIPDMLDLGSDLSLRFCYFTSESIAHPAKCHLGLLQWLIDRYTRPGDTIADPMAGVGSTLYAALLQRNVIAREIEPRWLELLHKNAAKIIHGAGLFAGTIDVGQSDAREPWGYVATHVIMSPPYGNEFSTKPNNNRALKLALHKNPALGGKRWQQFLVHPTAGAVSMSTYSYGTHPAQIGHLRGKRYYEAMTAIYTQAKVSLHPSGYLILILKDHIRGGKRVETTSETITLCESLGFALVARHQRHVYPLSLWQRRRKEQGKPVVEEEDVLVFRVGSEAVS